MALATLLIVDDEKDIREVIKEILEDEGYEVLLAESAKKAAEIRQHQRPDLVLLDIWMPDGDGISLLKEWQQNGDLDFPVIMISGHGTVETAVEATRLGAYDFLEKPLSMGKLLITVSRALETDRLRRENIGLRRQAKPLEEPLGKSAVMQRVREVARRAASHDSWILISGEPGSGRATLARYIHQTSSRRDKPFVAVGAASIVRENAAVELFGSEEQGRIHSGLLESANGGTLYLSEVADMELEIQGKLLSTLDSHSFYRIGGAQPVRLDVRVIAATQRDLAERVRHRAFREDLYFRLNVLPLIVPPLRDHADDVVELLAYYVNLFVDRDNLPYRHFSVSAQNRLRGYGWPGNVRELVNLVQRMLILGSGPEISIEEVDRALQSSAQLPQRHGTSDFELPLREARERFERAYFEYLIEKTGGSVGEMARMSGIERTHLYRKLKSLGVNAKGL